MTTLDYFEFYVSHGLKVVPLYPNSKVPVGKRWNVGWDKDASRRYLLETPKANLGLLLGEVIDVEGDTAEANKLIDDLIGGCPHPTWRSSKSSHHLFINPDPKLTSTRFMGMEFRGKRHQSVLPPSVHESGSTYSWDNILFPVPTIPKALLDFYTKNRPPYSRQGARKKKLHEGLIRTRCNACNRCETIHKKRLALEVKAFAELSLLWLCHGCRDVDVRPACRRIRKAVARPLPIPQMRGQEGPGHQDVLAG